MFDHVAAKLPWGFAKRSRTPVHRHSRAAGHCETGIWKKTNRQDVRQIVLAARRYEVALKQRGARNGPLGAVALEVLELLSNLVDYRTGRLEPSLDTMMKKLRRSRDAIVRGLKALRSHGFIDWLRRYIETDHAGGKGPQVKQTSNAYRLVMPKAARALLGRYGKSAPLPDDRQQEDAARAATVEDYNRSIPMEDLLEAIEDPRIKAALKRVRDGIRSQRESAKQTESPSKSIYIRRE